MYPAKVTGINSYGMIWNHQRRLKILGSLDYWPFYEPQDCTVQSPRPLLIGLSKSWHG